MIYNVLSYLKSSAERFPQKIAFSDGENAISYNEAWEYIQTSGSSIQKKIQSRRSPVIVSIQRDIYDILTFFAIVYSGNFYVPVDFSLPEERVRHMIRTLSPKAIIFSEKDHSANRYELPFLLREELPKGEITADPGWFTTKDTDPLYTIFTSGSTGQPKGVVVSHRSVIDMAEQFTDTFGFNEHSVFGNQAPFDFDVSVKDIYLSIKNGSRLEILEKKLFTIPKTLLQRLEERKINTLIWAVSAMKILADLNTFKTVTPEMIQQIFFSGETMPRKTLTYWQNKFPDATFVNLYGPTEITCNCTYYKVTKKEDPESAIPIGKAFPNCSVFLLDDEKEICEENTIGEICVSGSCLALGYYNHPEETEKAFRQNPLETAYPEKIYRTGDLGYYSGGNIIFSGRKDRQIKHMGHRIETDEITLCANAAPGIIESACVYHEKASKIILFCRGDADQKELFAYFRKKLPRYMIPSSIVFLEAFPKNRTGKTDYNALLDAAKGE